MAKEGPTKESPEDAKKGKKKKGKKKGKKLILMIVPLVLIAAAGAAFGLGVFGSKPAKAAVQPPVNYDVGPITTNLDDGHIIQEQMTVVVSGGATAAQLKTVKPQITNLVIETLSGWSYNALLSPAGKSQLRHQIEKRFDILLKTLPGSKAKVTDLYFTSFIMQ